MHHSDQPALPMDGMYRHRAPAVPKSREGALARAARHKTARASAANTARARAGAWRPTHLVEGGLTRG